MKNLKAIINWYIESHTWTKTYVVTGYDQHDKKITEEITVKQRNKLANFLWKLMQPKLKVVTIKL